MITRSDSTSTSAARIVFVRHASVQPSTPPRFLGRLDPQLSSRGTLEARALVSQLADVNADLLACSPLRRARRTAEIALGRPVQGPELLDALQEIDFGDWDGMTFAQAAQANPEIARRWAELDPAISPPRGERIDHFLDRVERAVRALLTDPAPTTLVVAHGGVIRAAICRLLNLDLRSFFSFEISPASVTTLEVSHHGAVLKSIVPIPATRRP